MNERARRQSRRHGFIGMMEASKAVARALDPDPEITARQREIRRYIALGKYFTRTVLAIEARGSENATKIIEDAKADKARRNRNATSELLNKIRL